MSLLWHIAPLSADAWQDAVTDVHAYRQLKSTDKHTSSICHTLGAMCMLQVQASDPTWFKQHREVYALELYKMCAFQLTVCAHIAEHSCCIHALSRCLRC